MPWQKIELAAPLRAVDESGRTAGFNNSNEDTGDLWSEEGTTGTAGEEKLVQLATGAAFVGKMELTLTETVYTGTG